MIFLFLRFTEQIWQAALNHGCCVLYLQHRIDMGEVLSNPLTLIPLSLYHVDILKQATPKVKLLYEFPYPKRYVTQL